MFRFRCGGTIAQARSSAASRSGRAVGSASSARRAGPRSSRRRRGTSSTITSAFCWASIRIVRVSTRWSSPQTSTRRVGRLEVEVRDADEDRAGDRRRRRPDREGDDRLVPAALRVADPEDADRRVDLRRRRDRERGVRRDEDLGVAGLDGELLGKRQRVAEVAPGDASAGSQSIACRTRPRSVGRGRPRSGPSGRPRSR